MTRLVAMLGTIALVVSVDAQAQVPEDLHRSSPGLVYSALAQNRQELARRSLAYRPLKTPGHYSAQDWRAFIDSLWGPGPPTATKLQIFDFFWDLIDRQFAGFPNLDVKWDSVKAVYRPQIEAGVSRGRLWGIVGHMYLSLKEIHTWMSDGDLDSYFMDGGKLIYRPGIPAFFPSGWGWAGSFGAALTPLPDSSLLVYKALAGHPLGIVPGDIVLGYDRIPWRQLYPELLSAELPIEWWGETGFGSSPRSMTHALLSSAGSNWGLFDTLDVVKYATGDTVHLPTAPLTGLDYLSLFATEQLPIQGVQMPNYRGGERVTWGVLNGTSIGYVYVYRWNNADAPAFAAAIRDLVTVERVTGLILDFRYNIGSDDSWVAANAGLDYLFNEDPAGPSRWRTATRSSQSDHFGFSFSQPPASFNPLADYYDRPIAVLTGPQTWSLGEHTSFRMRFHPMVRFFGLPTNGAFVKGGPMTTGPVFGTWYYRYAAGQMQSLVNNEGFLTHKSFPVDEEVWLTRDGVAKGEDDVVKSALDWMNGLSYAHGVVLNKDTVGKTGDTLFVSTRVENPDKHALTISCIVTNAPGAYTDSVVMADDGLHEDGAPDDSVWGARITSPLADGRYDVSVRTDDATSGNFRRLANAASFIVSLTSTKETAENLPKCFGLDQNYPNPFNPSTTIKFELPRSSEVKLSVYDIVGREVAVLVNESKPPGSYEAKFDAAGLASGVYLYRLTAGSYVQTRKMTVVK